MVVQEWTMVDLILILGSRSEQILTRCILELKINEVLMYNSLENPGLLKVLTFLQTHNTEYLSGQDLSDVLKISRVAIWKHIKKIQELGIHHRIKTEVRIQTCCKF